jgi:hypothetical protein
MKCEASQFILFAKLHEAGRFKEREMGGTRVKHGTYDKYIQYFSRKTGREETQAKMGG